MGLCDYPRVSQVAAIILLVLNIVFPGLGSIVGGIANEGGCDGGMVCAGLIQMFFCYLIVPYIWGIVAGVKMIQNATH